MNLKIKKTIKIAIIGSGRMGQRHAEAYKKNKNVEIVGFNDSIRKNANRLAKKFKTKALTIDEILLDNSIDAVNICTPNADHAKISIKMLKDGKHVLVEKPMAIKIKDCDKMIEIAKKNKLNLMIGQTYRFYPSSIIAKKIINDKKIGKIKLAQIHGIDPGFIKGQSKMPKWFGERKLGGGLIFDMIHMVDLLTNWFESDICEVYVPLIDKINKKVNSDQISLINLKFENGIAVSIMGIAPSWGIRDSEIKLIGEKGILSVSYGIEVKVGKKLWKTYEFPFKAKNPTYEHNLQGFVNELSEFISSIRENRNPIVTGEEGRKNLLVVLSMYESYKKNKLIKIKNK